MLRGRAYDYLYNFNNISALYSHDYKQQKSSQQAQHARYYQQHQHYLTYHSQAQQLLQQQQQQQQQAGKALTAPVSKTTNFNDDSVLQNAAVGASAYEPLRIPSRFYHLPSHFYAQESAKRAYLDNVSDLPGSPFQAVSRLSPVVEKVHDIRICGREPEMNRYIESPLRPSSQPLESINSQSLSTHRNSPGLPPLISIGGSPDPSPAPSRSSHSPP